MLDVKQAYSFKNFLIHSTFCKRMYLCLSTQLLYITNNKAMDNRHGREYLHAFYSILYKR